MKPTAECPSGCDHSEVEHAAFDYGLHHGEAGIRFNIYTATGLREAYEAGHSVGELNRQAGAEGK